MQKWYHLQGQLNQFLRKIKMGTTPTTTDSHDHHHLQLNESTSTNRIDNLCTLISVLLAVAPLPQELVFEILVRLPVKSLLRFKCVSKSWSSLISSPQFIRSHYSTSSAADHDLNSQLLCTTYDPIPGIKQFSLYSALYEPSFHVSDIEYPSHKPDDQYPSIAGIVNGLVCLFTDASHVFIWNPVLKKSKILPLSNAHRCVGFGYDESNDDYKVVFATSVNSHVYNNQIGDCDKTVVKVYSLVTDSWSIFDNFESRIPYGGRGKYSNGKIHWIGRLRGKEWKIVSLDMLSEKYGELQLPDYEAGVSDMAIGVCGGRFRLLCDYDDMKKMDLWVMDKYGVEESWSKVASIHFDNLHLATPYSRHRVVCILRNGVFVLSDGSDFLVYHNEFRNIELGGFRRRNFHLYVESLVSPHGSGL